MTKLSYGSSRTLPIDFRTAVERIKAALHAEGFGVLSEIDIREAMRKKLQVEVPEHLILGACNPKLAHAALQAEPDLGLLLPCNVTIRVENGATVVSVVDARQMMAVVGNEQLKPIAQEANEALQRALMSL